MARKLILILSLVFRVLWVFGQNEVESDAGYIEVHPTDHLPPYIKFVDGFGEHPDWSHDGRFILFLDKPMGEVYELELATGLIRPKTLQVLASVF